MAYINRYAYPIYQNFDILSKFLEDLNLKQEMVYPVQSSGLDLTREPEIPSKGPCTSFGHRLPKLQRSPSAPPIKFYYADCLKNQRCKNRPKKERISVAVFVSKIFTGYLSPLKLSGISKKCHPTCRGPSGFRYPLNKVNSCL